MECTEDGVKASDSSGVCQGCIALPKHRLWMLTLRFKCSRRPSDEIVIINLGQSPLSLFSVGRVHCDANSSRTQELRVPFVGGHLAFRFKFVSKSGLGFGQIHLEQGRFVQFDYPELEDKGGGTVCSGLVRELRLQRVQGKQRSVELLEELDRLDRSPADLPHFDSELLQGTPQRFQKAELKSMLHEELTKELRRSEAEAEAVEVKAAVESEKMRLAKERLVLRKRKGCNASDALEKGEALVGRKVEIYDAETHRWKVGTVEAMRSRWVDQDTRLEITHKVSGLQPQTAISTSFEAHQQEEAMWQDLLSQQFVLLDADEEEMEIRRKTRGKTRYTYAISLLIPSSGQGTEGSSSEGESRAGGVRGEAAEGAGDRSGGKGKEARDAAADGDRESRRERDRYGRSRTSCCEAHGSRTSSGQGAQDSCR